MSQKVTSNTPKDDRWFPKTRDSMRASKWNPFYRQHDEKSIGGLSEEGKKALGPDKREFLKWRARAAGVTALGLGTYGAYRLAKSRKSKKTKKSRSRSRSFGRRRRHSKKGSRKRRSHSKRRFGSKKRSVGRPRRVGRPKGSKKRGSKRRRHSRK